MNEAPDWMSSSFLICNIVCKSAPSLDECVYKVLCQFYDGRLRGVILLDYRNRFRYLGLSER